MDETTDTFWIVWLDVCDRRRSNGFASLTENERMFYGMNLLKGAVQRGGFHPYFDMASRPEIDAANTGFRAHGAPEIATLLLAAQNVLFPNGVPENFQDQLEELPCWTEEEIENDIDPPWSVAIERLNQEFYSQSQLVYEIVDRFFTEHIAAR